MTVDLQLVIETDAENQTLGDLRVEGGVVQLVRDADAIAQEVRVTLRWWRGEWFLDTSAGMPYLEQLLGKGISEETIREMLTARIEAVPGVGHVESIEIDTDRARRVSSIDIVIVTEEGETVELADVVLGAGGVR
jgi:hypothetical protein